MPICIDQIVFQMEMRQDFLENLRKETKMNPCVVEKVTYIFLFHTKKF